MIANVVKRMIKSTQPSYWTFDQPRSHLTTEPSLLCLNHEKNLKQVWKIWLQQVWKNMIEFFHVYLEWPTQTVRIIFQQKVWCDNGIKFTWFDWGKRFESSFNRRFDLTMESRWLALIHFVVWIIFEGQTHLKHRRDVTETMHLQRMMDQDVQLWLDQKVFAPI